MDLFIIICAALQLVLMVLSAFDALNGVGYTVAAGVLLLLAWVMARGMRSEGRRIVAAGSGCDSAHPSRDDRVGGRQALAAESCAGARGPAPLHDFPGGRDVSLWCLWTRFRLRFSKPLPVLYVSFLILSAVGAILYEPNDYDYLIYRLPRMLDWWAEERVHWIDNIDNRANYSGRGAEAILMPLLVFSRSTRLFPLLTLVCYALLPGQLFHFFRNVGVRRRTAWQWMWVGSACFGYVMQAGGAENDLPSVLFVLAAVNYGFSYRRTGEYRPWVLALLSAAVMTSVKASTLPLLLPIAVLMIPRFRAWLFRRWVLACIAGLVALSCSFLPQAVLNIRYTGDWSGDPENKAQVKLSDPVAGVVGNTILVGVGMVHPPVHPVPELFNRMLEQALPEDMLRRLDREYPRFQMGFVELPDGDRAGIGVGVTLALMAVFFFSIGRGRGYAFRKPRIGDKTPDKFDGSSHCAPIWIGFVWLGFSIAVLVYMTNTGTRSAPRHMLPYYPFFIAAVLRLRGAERMARRRGGTMFYALCMALAFPLLVLDPSRPLWPWRNALHRVESAGLGGGSIKRIRSVYETYEKRADALDPLRGHFPEDIDRIGVFGFGSATDVSLWKPFSSRRVVRLGIDDMQCSETLDSRDISFLVLRTKNWPKEWVSIESWVDEQDHSIVARETIMVLVSEGPDEYLVIELSSRNKR